MHDLVQTLTYNGWRNRETWVMNLWLTSEPYTNDVLQHIVADFGTLGEQAEELEHWVRLECGFDNLNASMTSDLIGTALGRIDWYEIVQNNQ